jgi:hypothetical protein
MTSNRRTAYQMLLGVVIAVGSSCPMGVDAQSILAPPFTDPKSATKVQLKSYISQLKFDEDAGAAWKQPGGPHVRLDPTVGSGETTMDQLASGRIVSRIISSSDQPDLGLRAGVSYNFISRINGQWRVTVIPATLAGEFVTSPASVEPHPGMNITAALLKYGTFTTRNVSQGRSIRVLACWVGCRSCCICTCGPPGSCRSVITHPVKFEDIFVSPRGPAWNSAVDDWSQPRSGFHF